MNQSHLTIGAYSAASAALARQTCLHVAMVLGDCLENVTIVGGMVPSLLIPQNELPDNAEGHAGTLDLDLGLDLVVLEHARYATIAERLRGSGFEPDRKETGERVRQRWRSRRSDQGGATIDFLIPRSPGGGAPGTLQNLEADFAAIVTGGLHLTARDRVQVSVAGSAPDGITTKRDVWVCGPGAFVVLKALAVYGREKWKDAYDLVYVVQNYGVGARSASHRLAPLLDDAETKTALSRLRSSFASVDSEGPVRSAMFRFGRRTGENALEFDNARANAHAVVQDLLRMVSECA